MRALAPLFSTRKLKYSIYKIVFEGRKSFSRTNTIEYDTQDIGNRISNSSHHQGRWHISEKNSIVCSGSHILISTILRHPMVNTGDIFQEASYSEMPRNCRALSFISLIFFTEQIF